jgi:hypothetical protein
MSLHTKSIQQLNTSFSSKTQFFFKKLQFHYVQKLFDKNYNFHDFLSVQ